MENSGTSREEGHDRSPPLDGWDRLAGVLVRFDDFTLDQRRFELTGPDGPVHLEPQVFDVLAYLVEHRDRVVPKSELLEQIWGSRFVSESALASRIKEARRATGDDGERQAVIATIRGRGFRFVAEVTEVSETDSAAHAAGAASLGRSAGLPLPWAPIVGREGELADLLSLMRDARLLTVLGPGGVGKTRVAVEVARTMEAEHGLAGVFADLTRAGADSDVARVVAEAIGVPLEITDGAEATITEALRSEQRLLVLDNAEHVIDGVVDLTRHLAGAPGVHLLVTSRERLRISGEQVYALAPLATRTNEGSAPAIDLFELAGRRLDPDFAVDDDNRADVLALCDAVDGLPLGIELVAAHVRLLPPAALRRHLGDRLTSVTGGTRDTPARQQTMGDTIDWSIRLLDDDERRMLARLSVFRVGADLRGVEEVAVRDLHLDAVSAVASMTDKSMLRRMPGADGRPRFGMLPLVREYVERRLADSDDLGPTLDRHAAHHHALVHDIEERRWEEGLAGVWASLLSERFGDLDAALRHDFSEGDPARAASTVGALFGFWHRDGRLVDGRRWTREAMVHAERLTDADRGRLAMGAGYLDFFAHRTEQARAHWERAIELFTDAGHDRYRALSMVDAVGTWMGQPGHQDHAIAMCQEGTRLSRKVGDAPLVAHALNVLGELQRLAGYDDQARASYEEALALTSAVGDEGHQAIIESNLVVLALQRGDAEQATALARSALGRAVRLRRQARTASVLVVVTGLGLARGEHERAALVLGAAEAGLDTLGVGLGPGDQGDHERFRREISLAVGEKRFAELTEAGRRMSLAEAADEALRSILA